MAASHNLPQSTHSGKSPISKSGVLTIHGFGLRVRMQSGHLEIEDGVGPERRKIRLARVGHRLKRLVCTSADGFATFGALKWLADVGASFVMLTPTGRVLFVTGPTASSDARLRRAQSLALNNGIGLDISRALIDAKIAGQQRVTQERLNDPATAGIIATFRDRLAVADTLQTIRTLEAHAAVAYFGAWSKTPVLWPKADLRQIPNHWLTVGSRHSPLSGGPRLAVTPVHAILNYCFALLESESRLALTAMGLDPGLGLGLHTDTPNRDSLALDVLEPVRPQIEDWLLNWISQEPLRRADFFETETGNCRLRSQLCSKLSDTAPTWAKLIAPWAEHVARALWNSTRQSGTGTRVSTPLTQQHRREAKGQPSFPKVETPKPRRLCRSCGKEIQRDNTYCAKCSRTVALENFDAGRKDAQRPEFLAKRAGTMLRHRNKIREWKTSDLPAWLTRDVYVKAIQRALAEVPKSQIRLVLGVSEPYSSAIQEGRRVPHPRHWQALAKLAGVEPVLSNKS
jgi:CRISPR-associated endonuclease Cas1